MSRGDNPQHFSHRRAFIDTPFGLNLNASLFAFGLIGPDFGAFNKALIETERYDKVKGKTNLNLKVKQLTIEKTESNGLLETFIETEQEKYEAKNGIACNYTPFCFVARIDDIVVGAISGATFFAEIYIDELVVTEAHRRKGIGRKLIETVLEYYKDCGFRNINCCTNEFQAPGFYEKCGFELEFVRRNKDNPKLSKYFYIKYLA